MKVQVTVTNRGGTSIVGLHYRRVFDWDVTPAEFSESVTFAKVPNADDSFVRYASDDGFANPDPALRADPWLQGTRGDPVFQWCIHHACRLQRIAHQDRREQDLYG